MAFPLLQMYLVGDGDGDDGDGHGPGGIRNPADQPQRDLTTQLVISITVGVIAFLTFCTVRTRWTALYSTRKRKLKAAQSLPDLPDTFLGWIPVLYSITEEQVLQSAGLDAVIFLGFFKMCARFLAVASILAALVLTPIHVKYEGMKLGWGNSTDWLPDIIGSPTTNLHFRRDLNYDPIPLEEGVGKPPKVPEKTDANYLWAYVAFVYIFTWLCLHLLFQQTKRVISIRQRVLAQRKGKRERTILLSGIPETHRKEDKIKKYLEERSVGNVETVNICRNYLELDILMEEREKILYKLESAYSKYHDTAAEVGTDRSYLPTPRLHPSDSLAGNTGPSTPLPLHSGETDDSDQDGASQPLITSRRPCKKSWFPEFAVWKAFFARRNVNNINYLTMKLAKLDTSIRESRNKRFPETPLAFVTFKTVLSAQIATQTLLDPKPRKFIAHHAPAPADIIWQNTYLPRRERLFRTWTISIFICILTILWFIPVGVLAVLLKLEPKDIKKVWKWLGDLIESSSLASSLIQNTLSTVAITALGSAVPYIYDWMSWHQAFLSAAAQNASVISKNFFFTFFNLFIAFSVFGTAANFYSFLDYFKDTTKIAYALAESLQGLASFYVNLIVLQALAMLPLRLLDIGSLTLYPYTYFTAPSRAKAGFQQPTFAYQFNLPAPLLIFNLCLAYSILSSGTTILIFGLIYFIISFFVYKHQLLYSHRSPYHTPSDSMWSMIFYRVIVGLLVFQASMAGFLALRKAFTRAGLVGFAILASVWAAWWFRVTYERPGRDLALGALVDAESAVERDGVEEEEEEEEELRGLDYTNPSLTSKLRGYREFGVGDFEERV